MKNIRIHGLVVVFCCALISIVAAQTPAPPAAAQTATQGPAAKDGNKKDKQAKQANRADYFISSQVDWVPLLPPPPAANSPEQQRDVQDVLDLQAANRKGERRER